MGLTLNSRAQGGRAAGVTEIVDGLVSKYCDEHPAASLRPGDVHPRAPEKYMRTIKWCIIKLTPYSVKKCLANPS